MTGPPNVTLALVNRAENVALVREMLAGLADGVDLGDALDDIKAAVSEAANNVVIHAYEGAEGPLEVEVAVGDGELDILVRDAGIGTPARVEGDEHPATGIGLAVIEALTMEARTSALPGLGTEVAMRFAIPPRGGGLAPAPGTPPPALLQRVTVSGATVEVAIAPPSLAAGVLGRLVGALAARAGFSIDRLSDTQLLTDALGARIATVVEGPYLLAGLTTKERSRAVSLRLRSLRPGARGQLLSASSIGALGTVIERLSDTVEVGPATSESAGREAFELTLRDARAGSGG